MQASEFDKLLRDKYEEYTPAYDEKAWMQLTTVIPTAPKKRRFVIWPIPVGIAASVGAAIIVMLWHPLQHQSVRPIAYARPTTETTTGGPATVPHSTVSAPLYEKPASPYAAKSTIVKKAQQSYLSSPANPEEVVKTSISNDRPVTGHTEEITGQQTAIVVPTKPRTTVIDRPEPYIAGTKTKKVIISLAGGVQYGTLNAGYAAGLNVHHQLSKRWSIESDISYVKYGSSGLQSAPETVYKNGSNTAFAQSAQTKQGPVSHPVMQYVQATPGIAFSVTKIIAIGAAVDLQRNIGAGADELRTSDEESRIVPTLDVGAAGRAEFRISKHMKAGIIYRQGINNLLQAGHNYLDRKYLQLQLKIPLLGK